MARRVPAGLAAAGCAALLASAALRAPYVPLALRAALLAHAALSLWRPDLGLLALAVVLPISNWFGRMWTGSGLMWPNVAMVAFGFGFFATSALGRLRRTPAESPGSDEPLRACAATMAAVAGAALI